MVIRCHDIISMMEQQGSEEDGWKSHFSHTSKTRYETVLFS